MLRTAVVLLLGLSLPLGAAPAESLAHPWGYPGGYAGGFRKQQVVQYELTDRAGRVTENGYLFGNVYDRSGMGVVAMLLGVSGIVLRVTDWHQVPQVIAAAAMVATTCAASLISAYQYFVVEPRSPIFLVSDEDYERASWVLAEGRNIQVYTGPKPLFPGHLLDLGPNALATMHSILYAKKFPGNDGKSVQLTKVRIVGSSSRMNALGELVTRVDDVLFYGTERFGFSLRAMLREELSSTKESRELLPRALRERLSEVLPEQPQ